MADNSQYQNILVAVDGSKATAGVLEAGIKAALRNNAHLDILTITQVDQLTDGYSDAGPSDDQTYSAVHATRGRMDDLKQKAQKAGVTDVSIHIRFGAACGGEGRRSILVRVRQGPRRRRTRDALCLNAQRPVVYMGKAEN